jgi:hypothetical protein
MGFPSDSLADLRASIDRDQLRAKPKFCLKFVKVLRHSLTHPGDIGSLGAGWCSDGVHFVCNSQIIGDFLKLKANSINTNLRDHGFVIDSHLHAAYLGFASLPDAKNWKVRSNPSVSWSSATTDAEAGQIPARELRGGLELVPAQQQPPALIPETLQQLLAGQEDTERDVMAAIRSAESDSDAWRREFLFRATAQWLSMSPSLSPIPHFTLLHHIMESANPSPPPSHQQLVETNVGYLIGAQSSRSQTADGIPFVDFLRLMLRFGLLERIAGSVYQLTDVEGSRDNLSFGSFGRTDACFAKWFSPSSDRNEAQRRLRGGLPWIVRLATAPNVFTIMVQNQATHIRFNPMPLDDTRQFDVEFDEGDRQSFASWRDLLVMGLELTIPTGAADTLPRTDVEFVPAKALVRQQQHVDVPLHVGTGEKLFNFGSQSDTFSFFAAGALSPS